jgi:hypothetical protein
MMRPAWLFIALLLLLAIAVAFMNAEPGRRGGRVRNVLEERRTLTLTSVASGEVEAL